MILGDGLRMRAIEPEDLPRYVEWFNDREVTRSLNQFLPMSSADEQAWYEGLKDRDPRERPLAIDVRQDTAWVHVGGCGLFDFDDRARSAELGIAIGEKRFWDQGVGTEALRALIDFGFNTLNLRRIMLRVYDFNPRAIHVYEKLGFVEEGRLRQSTYHDGEYRDTILMSILKSENPGREDDDG